MANPAWAQRLPWDLIRAASKVHGLDPELVAAVVQVESAGNPFAMRCEVRQQTDDKGYPMMTTDGLRVFVSLWKYFLNPEAHSALIGSSGPTEWIGQLTGWGPMQVQGTVAREHGFRGWFPQLCQWDIGVEYGCRHLRQKAQRFGTDPEVLYAAYNGGSPRKLKSGFYQNQRNVDRFMAFYREVAV